VTELACDMSAIPPAEREEHQRVTRCVVAAAIDIVHLADGFALQLPADSYETVMQYVARERLCCPFLRFSVTVLPGGGPVWLHLDGPPGTREFLRLELHLPASQG
jgi:hypothetical protein